jgi:hypothetical protein
VWAVSSDAADTSQTIQINGIRSGGLLTGDQSVTMNGTTRAAVGSLTDYVDITTVSLSAVAAGKVTLYDASSSGNILAEIAIGHLAPSYLGVFLYPQPTSAVTYYADGLSRIIDMDDTVDVPLLPEEFHDLLIPATLMIEYEYKDDARYQKALVLFKDGLDDLKYHLAGSPATMPTLGQASLPRTSRLGGWYPAD